MERSGLLLLILPLIQKLADFAVISQVGEFGSDIDGRANSLASACPMASWKRLLTLAFFIFRMCSRFFETRKARRRQLRDEGEARYISAKAAGPFARLQIADSLIHLV